MMARTYSHLQHSLAITTTGHASSHKVATVPNVFMPLPLVGQLYLIFLLPANVT